MADPADRAPELAGAVGRRTGEVIDALRALDDDALLAPSRLPDWDRLTIACHLRFGAEAVLRLTAAALEGRAAAYYPGGRAQQRPGTLTPRPGESMADVVASLAVLSHALGEAWSGLVADDWRAAVREPPGQPDLGELSLAHLALLRLTEVEVHGLDLDLGLRDWTDLFVEVALRARLDRLNVRRSNHRVFATDLRGSWRLVAEDGPTYLVAVDGDSVRSRPAGSTAPASAAITASSRDLLALLLGRPCVGPVGYDGDAAFARSFTRAFPGP